MINLVLVKIYWNSPDKGGRQSLPTGKTYSTISRFNESEEEWLKEAWSIVLEFDEPASKQGNPSIARAKFLSDEAPINKLRQGDSFELFEGAKKVADVEVLVADQKYIEP